MSAGAGPRSSPSGPYLPPEEWLQPPESPHGRGRTADGLPAGGRHTVHGRSRHGQPEGRLRGGQLRPRRGPGLRVGERGRLQGAGRRDVEGEVRSSVKKRCSDDQNSGASLFIHEDKTSTRWASANRVTRTVDL